MSAQRVLRPTTAFQLSTAKKRARQETPNHLAFIRGLPCLVCLAHPVDAAHVRYGSLAKGKPLTGAGEKPSDKWTVPLCRVHHSEQHGHGERGWWLDQGIDPIVTAALLWAASGDAEAGEAIVYARATGEPVRRAHD